MSYSNNLNFDRISEEALGDIFLSPTNENEALSQLGFDNISINDLLTSEFSLAGTCNDTNLMKCMSPPAEPNELDRYLGLATSEREENIHETFSIDSSYAELPFDHDNSLALMPTWSVPVVLGKQKSKKSHTKPIPLSQSVGVGLPQKTAEPVRKISVLFPLEESYRSRYKSDYFTQTGKVRKPRYITDRSGNHCVTIKMQPGARGVIRVDWLTLRTESGDLYSMPYRFQQCNTSPDVPDCNPIHISVHADQLGLVKLYLVLIKSKQDELKSLQPLQPFHPLKDVFGILDKKHTEPITPLNPKQLIQKYQLDKSQLAFTFCAFASDRKSCIPEWDTTVYSTILTEMPSENSKQKTITCPQCMHSFPLPTNGGDDDYSVQETVGNKRQPKHYIDEPPIQTMKKSKFFQTN